MYMVMFGFDQLEGDDISNLAGSSETGTSSSVTSEDEREVGDEESEEDVSPSSVQVRSNRRSNYLLRASNALLYLAPDFFVASRIVSRTMTHIATETMKGRPMSMQCTPCRFWAMPCRQQ